MNDIFRYEKCMVCGCLQIENYPKNIADYYPSNYYSIQNKPHVKKNSSIKTGILKSLANQTTGYRKNLAGYVLRSIIGGGTAEKIRDSKISPSGRILEIGCGSGSNLVRLQKYGFTQLLGIDPFIEKDMEVGNGIRVLKRSVFEFEEKDFDLVFLNHVFEHMPDQESSLSRMKSFLSPNGLLVISIPMVDHFLWRKYGVNWVGLDAPRHYYLHSVKSFRMLAEKAGYEISRIEFKTTAFDFWASEQYLKGVPLQDESSYYFKKKNNTLFDSKAIKSFTKKAKELDSILDGSTAMFHLKVSKHA